MPFSSRRSDDADVIRARLRALLAEGAGPRGWLPDEEPGGPVRHPRTSAPVPAAWVDDEDDTDTWSVDEDDTDTWSVGPDDLDRGHVDRRGDAVPHEEGERGTGRHRASGPSTRIDPGPHGARTLWAVALLAALVVAGWSWLSRPEVSPAPVASGTPVSDASDGAGSAVGEGSAVPAASTGVPTGTPGAAPQLIVVAVVGQVVSPGVVTLPAGSRVADALAAAGGLLPEADPASINAAAVLSDGQQVAVGVPGAGGAPGATGGGSTAGGSGSGGAGGGALVDLNAAGLADLDALPGIGPVLAQRILDHRTEHGPFTSVEQLDDVAGIGPSLYAEIAPLVTV